MLRIFYDTEFTSLTDEARIISIGPVDESGHRSFYAELLDTWLLQECSRFTKETVLPMLEGGSSEMCMDELRTALTTWLTSFEADVLLVSDSELDAAMMKQIYPYLVDRPHNLIGLDVIDLPFHQVEPYQQALEQARIGKRPHHALDDARTLQEAIRTISAQE